MSIPIKVSELSILSQITNDDYIIVNDSGSTTTKRATFDTLGDYLSGSLKPVRSASYALTASFSHRSDTSSYSIFSEFSRLSLSSSYASRSTYTTYVSPIGSLPANTVNMIGTSSWAVSASNLPKNTYNITSSFAGTASFLLHDPNWRTTGNLNGSASYALSASVCDIAFNVVGGGGISGTSTEDFITKWSATGLNQPIENSNIWDNGVVIFRDTFSSTSDYSEQVNLANWATTMGSGFVFHGSDVILTGSAASTRRGLSNKIIFVDSKTTDACSIYFSSSFTDGHWDNGSMIFRTQDNDTEPFIFRTVNSLDGIEKDHVIIKPNGTDTYVDISGSLFCHGYAGIGNLMSRTGLGARLHVSGSTSDTTALFVTETQTHLGLYVNIQGQVGVGTTQPQTRLETVGSFSSPEYYVKDGSNYLKGISGTWIVFNTSDPNGVASRTYLTFNNGILVAQSAAPPLTQAANPPVSPPSTTPTTPPSGGGGGGCPAVWQEIETLELGFVPAEKVEKGMHLRSVDGWNLVFNAYNEEADIWRVVINGENYDVDASHLWLIEKNTWKRVTELKQHDFIMDSKGNYISIDNVYFLKRGLFRHLEVDRKSYVLGNKKLVGHNHDVPEIPVLKN